MTTVNADWAELSDRLEALGLKLKLHYEQSRDGTVTQTVDRLRQGVEDVFEAAGNAMKDTAVRADIRDVGRLFGQAVADTLERVGADIREAATAHRGRSSGDKPTLPPN